MVEMKAQVGTANPIDEYEILDFIKNEKAN